MSVCMYVCMCVCMYVCMCACAHVCMCVGMHVLTHTFIKTCMCRHACMYVTLNCAFTHAGGAAGFPPTMLLSVKVVHTCVSVVDRVSATVCTNSTGVAVTSNAAIVICFSDDNGKPTVRPLAFSTTYRFRIFVTAYKHRPSSSRRQ